MCIYGLSLCHASSRCYRPVHSDRGNAIPNTYTWRPGNTGYMFDPANYLDGTSFALGDMLDVHAGHLSLAALPGRKLGMTRTGIFIVTETGGADEDMTFNRMQACSTPMAAVPAATCSTIPAASSASTVAACSTGASF